MQYKYPEGSCTFYWLSISYAVIFKVLLDFVKKI